MVAYLIRRLNLSLVTVFGILALVFFVIRVIPGDPVHLMVGFEAEIQEIEIIRQKLGVDRPVYVQLVYYLRDLLHGDFGNSLRSSRPVMTDIGLAGVNTLSLVGVTIFITIVSGVLIGTVAARWSEHFIDHIVMIVVTLGMCIPSFFLALILMLIFSIYLGWLPAIGVGRFEHLILPALTLAAAPTAYTAKMTRSEILDILALDYVRTAYAKGLAHNTVFTRHVLRSSMIPIVTVIGLQTSYLLGGAVLVETIFAYPGIGWLLIESISARDFPVVQGCILFIAVTTVITNLCVDVMYFIVSPTIRSP